MGHFSYNYAYVYMSVCRCVHINVSDYRFQKWVLDAPGAGVTEGCEIPNVALSTKFRP